MSVAVVKGTELERRLARRVGFQAGRMNRHNGYVCYGDTKKPTYAQVREWADTDMRALVGYPPQLKDLVEEYIIGYTHAFDEGRAEYKHCGCARCAAAVGGAS